MQDKVKILGVNIDNITEEEAAEKTKELIEKSNKSCKLIVAPNVEFIMQAQKDKEFFDILQTAELATPDSVGVILAGKLQKKPFKQRIPGQAYFRKILETAEKEGWTVYLLGGKGDIPQRAKQNVEKLYPKLKIVGYHEGYFEEDTEEVVAGQGGTFDYEAGNIKRAPKWIQKIGMEWLWRLILQPSRIKRMIVLPVYLFKIIFTKDITKSRWEK